ncbi:Clavaminate synthase-like protein [Trametes versicolor FP-101664 SS1]|uniref:Clavaminate synthase-like protein n=1 Tax=Trametes versicolor (strain FP-101664) TaxID=717944 RepID=R7S8R8_TRAVS|nr:Clavaminate synthase-like protein [Trametes versicolor FP-101664 SS1]EIW52052.1 Clavaminate synthase-like protein [Trametes versicolor FP-101664 SS1]
MPATTFSSIPHYEPAPPTHEELEWADIPIIDISKAGTPEGRAELAPPARDAMRTQGFLYIINHGYTQTQNERVFDIADLPFAQVPEEEKRLFAGDIKKTGSYRGYKLRNYWHIDNGVHDQLEHYNLHRAIDQQNQQHPKALQPVLPEIRAFAEHNHHNVLHPLLRLLALGMELPEDALVEQHGFDSKGETYVRFMKYYPRTDDEEIKTKNVWLKGHTDFGTITILWSQPVSALQILSPDGKWRWVKHIPNALVVNAGDAMEFLSGGFYKATIHRVVQPPADQRGHTRVGAFYFAMTDDDVRLIPFTESAALQRAGIVRRCDDADAPTMEQWRRGRTSAYGQSELKKKDEVVEEEVINGVVVKHYN